MDLENVTFRLETKEDYRKVEEMTRETFWNLFKPGCEEHLIVHQLRQSKGYIPELDLIACVGDQIIGHILYTRSYVIDKENQKHEVLTFGPLTVLPEYQKSGIGTALVEKTIAMAKDMGFKGIFIYGHPDYYPRLGFVNAKQFNVTTPEGENFDYFMGIELGKNALAGISGRHLVDAAFEVNQEQLEAFDQTFPLKSSLREGK
jgi:predicted N-acetyltransferase YhbS